MAHLTGLRGPRACIRASVATAIAISLLLVTAGEGSHSHEESDPPDVCSVCELAHQGAPTPVIGTAVIVEPGVLQTPAPPGNRLISGTAHLSAHRSRAPPRPIAL